MPSAAVLMDYATSRRRPLPQPAKLLEHVREGFERYDAGTIDVFELDDLINHYKRAAQKLWSTCVGGGAQAERTARMLELQSARDEVTDWWELAAPRRRPWPTRAYAVDSRAVA